MREDDLALVAELAARRGLDRAGYAALLEGLTPRGEEELFRLARETARRQFGRAVYTRGLIEWSNVCANDCLYCGIRRSNGRAARYRLSREDILACCERGWEWGFRTFVLQGGEWPSGEEDRFLAEVVEEIRRRFPRCAVTLSVGERERAVYRRFYEAGATRYLLRHETADPDHYRQLHPASMSLERRKQCLWDLKDLGFQVGTGFMVGSPGQTAAHLARDLEFIQELQPHMVGIGPFVPHRDTPFRNARAGGLEDTVRLIAVLRLMLPAALIPATTALGTIAPDGREQGILAGANVVMPNLSPAAARESYTLYDNKLSTGAEGGEGRALLARRLAAIGYTLSDSRGDWRPEGAPEAEE